MCIAGKKRRRRLHDLSIVQNTPNLEEGNSEQQTVVGSSNVAETLDDPEEFQNPVERVKVSRNTYGQPVGSEARLLAGYLGILARNANMLSINYESWHHMPDSNKNQALANIKATKCEWSRSFASVAEAEEVKSGQKVGRLQLFEITHRKKDGSPMTSEAGEIMEKLKEKKAEYEATTSTDSSVNLENIDNKIITEVLGPERNGRVRFQGSSVIPTQYFGSGSQQYMPSRSQAKAEVQSNNLERRQQRGILRSSEGGSGSSEGGRGSSDGSRAEQKVRLPPVTASTDDADVSTVAKAAILDISFLVQRIKNIRTLLLQNCSPKCSEFWGVYPKYRKRGYGKSRKTALSTPHKRVDGRVRDTTLWSTKA
ncbi:hypothetical protein PVK06_023828 [Gossypium arboreum]|uniref:Uncharacterized protein n=1 Tax=Gossypium arboreum TaxID=29729 RepID=A0ABR0PCD8_GOSAR|nr:hypothetical protein PVK06_023828 [Gossypium arboreum]